MFQRNANPRLTVAIHHESQRLERLDTRTAALCRAVAAAEPPPSVQITSTIMMSDESVMIVSWYRYGFGMILS